MNQSTLTTSPPSYPGSWWQGYDSGANEEKTVRDFADKVSVTAVRAAVWTKQNLDYALDVMTQVQGIINEGGDALMQALLSGDSVQLDAILDSLSSKASTVSREAMHLIRLAMIEIGHAIVDMTTQQAGYIVGTVAYEAVETAVLAAIEAGMAAVTVGTSGVATPATAGGTAAIVSAKGVAVAGLVSRLSKNPAIKVWPEVLKAVDKFGTFVKWTLSYPMCFVAGTKVHTYDGLKNIEDICPGDIVLTRDEDAPESTNRHRRVTELFRTNPTRLLTVRYQINSDGREESLTCTGEHPFFVRKDVGNYSIEFRVVEHDSNSSMAVQTQIETQDALTGKFTSADELRIGDSLVLADHRHALIIEIEEHVAGTDESFTTYNFSVQGDHTYFVGEAGVWVHNAGAICTEASEIFAREWAKSDDVLTAAKEARDFLTGKLLSTSAVEIRKHMDDLEGLLRSAIKKWEIEEGKTFWKKHLEQTLQVARPTTPLPNGDVWHAHHILFKSGQVGRQADLVKEGQEILRQVGIDPLFGKEVFVWAPMRAKGQHHVDSLEPLVVALKAAPKGPDGKPVYKAIVAILEKFGREAAKRGT